MISCYHLSIAHPHRQTPLLDDVSFDIERGKWAEIVGATGAGKSVLMSILALRSAALRGKCIIGGRNLDRLEPAGLAELRRSIGSCAQRPRLLEERTVVENLLLPLVARDEQRDALARVESLLAETALSGLSEARAGALSDSQRKLTGILRAVVGRPRLVLVDGGLENLGDLAVDAARALERAHDAGATVVLASRSLSPLSERRDLTFWLRDGRLLDEQPADDGSTRAMDGAA